MAVRLWGAGGGRQSQSQKESSKVASAEMGRAVWLPTSHARTELHGQTMLSRRKCRSLQGTMALEDSMAPRLPQMLINYAAWTRGLIPLTLRCSSVKRG